MESVVTIRGRATIPKAIRVHLNLKPGDRVNFFVHPDGTVAILPRIQTAIVRPGLQAREVKRRER